ncbi:MAG: hypothetical protein CSA96_05035 [Bacteroidetes bacterium]|nr:MAG: hypothetical protein CSA96_05035 [Bacteroidota bacterium]
MVMEAAEFIRLLESDKYSREDLVQVNALCREYPMFSLAHMLRVRILEAHGMEEEKAEALRIAAIYAGSRKRLYDFVHHLPDPVPPGEIEFSLNPEQDEVDVVISQEESALGTESDHDLLDFEAAADDESAGEVPVAEEGGDESAGENLVSEEPGLPAESAVAPETAEVSESPEVPDAEASDASETAEVSESPESPDAEAPDAPETAEVTEAVDAPESGESSPTEQETRPHGANAATELEARRDRQLIQAFIRSEPGPIRADSETNLKGDVSMGSGQEHDGFITDTLAEIYVKQKRFAKAIYAYEKLSLKYPEKSAYFAAQIEKIRNLNHS